MQARLVEPGQLAPAQVAPGRGERRAEPDAASETSGRALGGQAQDLGLLLASEPALVALIEDERRRRDAQLVDRRATQLLRLHDRHLLGDRHQHERGAIGVLEEGEDAPGVVADRAHRHRSRGGQRHLEEGQAVAGGGRVDDDQVVAGPGGEARSARLFEDHDLAQHHQLGQARRRREEAPVDRAPQHAPREHLHAHDATDVFVHHRRGVEVDGEEAGPHLRFPRPHRGGAQIARGLEGGVDLDEQDALAALARGHRERGAHHALARASLAGEDHEAPREQLVEHRARLT